MSAKWIRSQAWDREHLTGVLTPVRWVVHAFSTITMAVILLIGVALYGTLASVPVGMLAQVPTYAVYGLTYVVFLVLVWLVPLWAIWKLMGSRRIGLRFVVAVVFSIAAVIGASYLWYRYAWPVMHYDWTTGRGLMFFADFAEKYKAVTVRRLPGMEMTELEFYAWWPLNWLLYLFVINMIVATVRRIDFAFEKIGVLSVHAGIVIMALGSAWYSTFKQEGDMLLLAGMPDAQGNPTIGRAETGFFDNTRIVLRTMQVRSEAERAKLKLQPDAEWEQRLLTGVPRYNDYNLSVAGAAQVSGPKTDEGRTLSVPVPTYPPPDGFDSIVDRDIEFRVVGYASYADLVESWAEGDAKTAGEGNVVRMVDILTAFDAQGRPQPGGAMTVARTLALAPDSPADRVAVVSDVMGLEYTRNMPDSRWKELAAPLKEGARHGLIVEIPGANIARTYAVTEGEKIVLESSGYAIEVRGLMPTPPFPIITPTHAGATSSVAIVRVTAPGGKSFDRYVYSRFPELNQDLSLTETNDRGMPKRSNADASIRLTYIDASIVQVYMDEQPSGVRAIVRTPGSTPRITEGLKDGGVISIAPVISARLGARMERAVKVAVPRVVPMMDRERDATGTHRKAALAVEVRVMKGSDVQWRTVRWIPFNQYAQGSETVETAKLGDGRVVEMSFGRLWRPLPGMQLQLTNFEMFPYPHSEQPRDFRSDLLVTKFDSSGRATTEARYTSLNDPLLVSSGNPLMGRYKFSQSGWDNTGWMQSKAQMKKPFARFTILGVGNNPGINIIAGGAVLTVLGIPWAFYIKPWLVKRKSEKLRALHGVKPRT